MNLTTPPLPTISASKPLQPNQLNYWSNTPAFFVSFLKWMYGENATAENNWGYDWLPKWDKMYDILQLVELMYQGKVNGLLVQGFNAQGSFPDAHRVTEAFSKLKYMVVMETPSKPKPRLSGKTMAKRMMLTHLRFKPKYSVYPHLVLPKKQAQS